MTLRTAAELAAELSVSETFVEQECRAGRWPHSEVLRRSVAFTSADISVIRQLHGRRDNQAPVTTGGTDGQPRLLYRLDDAAAQLSIGRTKLYGLMRTDAIPTIILGGRRYIAHQDLVDFVDRLLAKPEPWAP